MIADTTIESRKGSTQVTTQNADGSTTTMTVDGDGRVARTTMATDPSTGRTTTRLRGPDGTETNIDSGPDGEVQVTTYPDGRVERTEMTVSRPDDRTTVVEHVGPDGEMQTTTTVEGADGTVQITTERPGEASEVVTHRSWVDADGTTIREVTGPDGVNRMDVHVDGTTLTTFTRPDGIVEVTSTETLPDGTQSMSRAVDGQVVATQHVTPVPGGERTTTWSSDHPDDPEIVTTTSRQWTTEADGPCSEIVTVGPGDQRVEEVQLGTDGAGYRTVRTTEGVVEESRTTIEPDGTRVDEVTEADGRSYVARHRVVDGVHETTIQYDDDTTVVQTVEPDGTVTTRSVTADGETTERSVAPDGSGFERVVGPDGSSDARPLDADPPRHRGVDPAETAGDDPGPDPFSDGEPSAEGVERAAPSDADEEPIGGEGVGASGEVGSGPSLDAFGQVDDDDPIGGEAVGASGDAGSGPDPFMDPPSDGEGIAPAVPTGVEDDPIGGEGVGASGEEDAGSSLDVFGPEGDLPAPVVDPADVSMGAPEPPSVPAPEDDVLGEAAAGSETAVSDVAAPEAVPVPDAAPDEAAPAVDEAVFDAPEMSTAVADADAMPAEPFAPDEPTSFEPLSTDTGEEPDAAPDEGLDDGLG